MSTPEEEFISACFDELALSQRFVPYVQKAEAASYPQAAKIFRALVACETARESLMRTGFPHHLNRAVDFYVCPRCGLIYDLERPEQCLVDETPGAEFVVIR